MRYRSLSGPISTILFLFIFIAPVFAESDGSIDLSSFGTSLGEKLGIGDFAGNLLMGLIILLVLMFPIIMISRRRGSGFMAEMIFGIATMCFNIAVGFWPPWILIIVCFLIALLFADKIADILG